MIDRPSKLTATDLVLGAGLVAAALYTGYRITQVVHYHWQWGVIPQYLFRWDAAAGRWVPNLLMQGLFTTIRLSVWATLLATVLGTAMGLCRTGKRLFFRMVGRTYVELIRNLPPLVLIFIFYFFVSDQIMPVIGVESGVSHLTGPTRAVMSFLFGPMDRFAAFLSGVITLAIFEGAYIAEIVRAGIQSIEAGQWEAASAMGMSPFQRMRHVILPQAVERILPPLANQFISAIKDSAIVSVISIQELTFQGTELMSATYLTFEIWITITLMYLALTLPCSLFVERLAHRLRSKGGNG